MRALHTFWKFSRPHTVIGSTVSIVTLYVMLSGPGRLDHLDWLGLALVAGIAVNVFIVGLNQIADVEIDRINKPWLPIPAGKLQLKEAKVIVLVALFTSLLAGLYLSRLFFVVLAISAFIGWAYSMPPFFLKRHHLPAALAISAVRGLLVNLGGFFVFMHHLDSTQEVPRDLQLLTCFIVMFSIVIAWFKDLPDVRGDAQYQIRTFAVLYSRRTAYRAGTLLLSATYIVTICLQFSGPRVLFYGHISLFGLFLMNTFSVDLENERSVTAFYKRFWWFFFAEYLVYLVAYWG